MREVNNNLAANPPLQPAKPVEAKPAEVKTPVAETPAKEIKEIPNNPTASAVVKTDNIENDLKMFQQNPAAAVAAMNIGDALQKKLEQSGTAPVDAAGQAATITAAAAQELK